MGEPQRRSPGFVCLLLRDVTVLDHSRQNDSLALLGHLEVDQGGIDRRGGRQTGDERRFGQREVAGGLAELGFGGFADSIGA